VTWLQSDPRSGRPWPPLIAGWQCRRRPDRADIVCELEAGSPSHQARVPDDRAIKRGEHHGVAGRWSRTLQDQFDRSSETSRKRRAARQQNAPSRLKQPRTKTTAICGAVARGYKITVATRVGGCREAVDEFANRARISIRDRPAGGRALSWSGRLRRTRCRNKSNRP